MPTVSFDNGLKLNFDKPPTQQDVQEAYSQVTGKGGSPSPTDDVSALEGKQAQLAASRGQDFQSSPLAPMQRAMVAFPRTMQGKMKELQNLGVSPSDIGVDANNHLTIAGKPVTPTVHSLWDFMRDSLGRAAEGGVENLSLIGQIGADVAATTTGVGLAGLSVANAAGSAGGEALRQGVANALTGEAPNLSEVVMQGGLGAITPPVAMGAAQAIRGTKQVLLNGMAKVAAGGNADRFAQVAGQILKNTDPEHIQFAIDTIRKKGADAILHSGVADEDYAINFVRDNFFGDDIAKTIQTMSQQNPQVVRNLYTGVLGMPAKEVETLIAQGPAVYRMQKPEAMAQLAENITRGISDPKTGKGLLNELGGQLNQARKTLIGQAGGIDVSQELGQVNTPIFEKLVNLGMLKQEANGGYSLVKNWAGGLATGKAQQRIFTEYLENFARKKTFLSGGITQEAIDAAQKASAKEVGRGLGSVPGPNPLGDLLSQAGKGGKEVTTYHPDVRLNYKQFAQKMDSFNTRLGGNEFDAVGRLAPDLTQGVRGLRDVADAVAAKVGNEDVPQLRKQFEQLALDLGPLKQMVKSGSAADIQSYLAKIAEEKDGPLQARNYARLNEILKSKGINFLDDLNAYSASNVAAHLNTPEGKMHLLTSAQKLFDHAWEKNAVTDYVRTHVDPMLPAGKKIIENGKIHVVAKELDKDARSLLKARFISTGLLGGMVGMHMLGPVGGVAGLAAGFKLQNPEVLKSLLKLVAARGTGVAGKATLPKVSRPLVAVGVHKMLHQ